MLRKDLGPKGWTSALLCLAVVAAAGCRHGQPTPAAAPAAAEEAKRGGTSRPAGNVLSTEAIRDVKVARAEELMVGRFAGVDVVPLRSGGFSVRIRGTSSIMGTNEPLYVIDGMVVEPGPGGALLGINPADIARIEVLKDIGSTSLYGMRGANGVILITLRRR